MNPISICWLRRDLRLRDHAALYHALRRHARVYVGFDIPDGQLGLGTKMKLGLARRLFPGPIPDAAVNYVWDNVHPIGSTAPSANKTMPIAFDTGSFAPSIRRSKS